MANENRYIHNALKQARIKEKSYTLSGFSISGLATYHLMQELDFIVDLGECPLNAVPIDHVFLTHAHGDHSRCLMRHHSLRKMTGIERDSVYYLPEEICENARAWIKAEAMFENVPEYKFRCPEIVPMRANEKVTLAYRKDLVLEAFPIKHSIPGMGCTLYRFKKKLKDEYLGATPTELIELQKNKVQITREVFDPAITFMGDCKSESLLDNPQVFNSEVLVTECTFLDDGEEDMARQKSHSHLNDIVKIFNDLGEAIKCKTIVFNHFSMKYSEQHIMGTLEKKLPDFVKERVKVLI